MKRAEKIIIAACVAVFVSLIALTLMYPTNNANTAKSVPQMELQEAVAIINDGQASRVVRDGDKLYVYRLGGDVDWAQIDQNANLEELGINTAKTKIEIGSYATSDSTITSTIYALIPVLLIGSLLAFSTYIAYQVVRYEKSNKVLWLLLVILVFPIGAFIYYFVQRNRPDHRQNQ